MVRRWLAGSLVVFGLAILMFGPGRGAIALSTASQGFTTRLLHERFQEGELNELARLDCLEYSISMIPDGASAHLNPVTDPYVEQRLVEIAYPRIRLLGMSADYEIYVDRPLRTSALSKLTCGGTVIQVVKSG